MFSASANYQSTAIILFEIPPKSDYKKEVCDKFMGLIRILSGAFISYKTSLPDIFILGHPTGSVLGNAKYSDYLVIMQNVTINTGNRALSPPPAEANKIIVPF